MNKVRVTALKNHEWASTARKAGEIYEADADDPAFLRLLALELAKPVDKEPANPYKRRDMRPEK